jgi:hypothetical protein
MVVNFRTREISQSVYKLVRIIILKKISLKLIEVGLVKLSFLDFLENATSVKLKNRNFYF